MKITSGKLALFLLGSCLFIQACGSDEEKPKNTPKLVKTILVKNPASYLQYSYPGVVSANEKVDLAFQVSGQLREFPVVEGQTVKKDQLLGRLDQRDFANTVNSRRANYERAKKNLWRAKELLKTSTIPQAKYEEMYEVNETTKADLAISEKALEDTELVSPFAGVVANTYVNNFQNVRAKEKILSLQDIAHVEIIVDVPEQDFFQAEKIRVKKGLAGPEVGYITFAQAKDKKFSVKVKEYATEADKVTQTYRITLLMQQDQDNALYPGMSVTFYPSFNERHDEISQAYLVPVSAVTENEFNQHFVWIVDEESMQVKQQSVKVGGMQGDQIQVISGLKPGMRIVTAGVTYLRPDMKVRLFDEEVGY